MEPHPQQPNTPETVTTRAACLRGRLVFCISRAAAQGLPRPQLLHDARRRRFSGPPPRSPFFENPPEIRVEGPRGHREHDVVPGRSTPFQTGKKVRSGTLYVACSAWGGKGWFFDLTPCQIRSYSVAERTNDHAAIAGRDRKKRRAFCGHASVSGRCGCGRVLVGISDRPPSQKNGRAIPRDVRGAGGWSPRLTGFPMARA